MKEFLNNISEKIIPIGIIIIAGSMIIGFTTILFNWDILKNW